uniref:F-box and leucine rich repeat protein 2 n=1 Tax=Bos taurus TaxID=9913 RepID=A0AAA9RWI7_BOVIN
MVFSNNDEGLINKKLPKELLLRIFSFLDIVTLCRCAQISKAWNILALDGSNWQRIDLFNFQTDVEGRVVENISKRCGGFLRKLSLRGCIGVGDSSLKTFAQNCRNIEHLNLNGCTKITDSTCYSLSRFCSKLKHLDLTSCVSITNSSLKGISEGCRHLEYLNLSWCDQITKDGVEALVRGCRGLRALLLRGCTQLEDEALKHIQNYCHELVSLNLQSCSRVTDDGVVQLCRGCPRLQALCLSGCGSLTDASLTALALNCPRLQILEAARCSHLTDAGFTLLARHPSAVPGSASAPLSTPPCCPEPLSSWGCCDSASYRIPHQPPCGERPTPYPPRNPSVAKIYTLGPARPREGVDERRTRGRPQCPLPRDCDSKGACSDAPAHWVTVGAGDVSWVLVNSY